ncbi:cupin domain-containing protein [Candidatus Woesebacteria bacterium]|nr:cupin domain-containing protein [Candidatus Woesebacteria bacterium]
MHIARKEDTKKIKIGTTMVAYEYDILDPAIHGTLVELSGRYPEIGRVVNEKCSELAYVVSGSGKLVIEGDEIEFKDGDQLSVRPGERYYWVANAVMFMPCSPAWYPEQHKEVD